MTMAELIILNCFLCTFWGGLGVCFSDKKNRNILFWGLVCAWLWILPLIVLFFLSPVERKFQKVDISQPTSLGLKIPVWLYFSFFCLFISGPVLYYLFPVMLFDAGIDGKIITWVSGILIVILVLPLGLLAIILGLLLRYVGLLTPNEALLAVSPIAIVLGCIQWYIIIPRFIADRIHKEGLKPSREFNL